MSLHDSLNESINFIKEKISNYLLTNIGYYGLFTEAIIKVPASILSNGSIIDMPGFTLINYEFQEFIK